MRDKQDNLLTDRQARVVRAMSHSWEPAADIARRAEVDNRGVGAVLRSLVSRGMVVATMNEDGNPYAPARWRLV